MRMTPPLPSSPVPLGVSFARLASVSPPQSHTQAVPNRVQCQSGVKIRERGDSVASSGTTTTTGNNNRPAIRPLPYKSPVMPDLEPHSSTKMTSPSPKPPMASATATSSAVIGGVITKPTLVGPRSIGAKQKLSLQIPAIPMLEPEQQSGHRKPQTSTLKLVTDTVLQPASTNSSPSIKLPPSPPSPSALSYVSYSESHSPVSRINPTTKQGLLTASSSSPVQASPTHSSLFSADSRIHLHPLSLSSPISTSGSTSGRTSVGGVGGTGGSGGVSPGGKSVKSLGGRRPRSVRSTRSTRSMRSNRSRRSTNKIKIHSIPASPDHVSITTPTPLYNTIPYASTHLPILGDHVGEYIVDDGGGGGDGDDGFGNGERDECYVEDGWVGGSSPSPIRYARPDSRGNLSSDGEGPGRVKETGDESAASSEVEFADVDGDSDYSDEDYSERRVRRRRGWRVDGGRGGSVTDNTPSMTTSSPTPSLSIPQFARPQAPGSSHHSSHSSLRSNPSASSPLSSSSTNSYSNPYSTRKDRKKARKTQLRSFRYSYRLMPPIVPLEEERGRGRGEEKGRGGQQGRGKRGSSPAVMASMIPFRRKTPPPRSGGAGGEEQAALDNTSARTKKKSKEKEKDGKKGKVPSSRKSTKSAIDLFNSMTSTYSQSSSQSTSHLQSTSFPPLPVPHPHSQSGSESASNTRAVSLERGRKTSASTKTSGKKFAESVSVTLEEVTTAGRGRAGVPRAPFQPPGKTNAVTAYSHFGTTMVDRYDEMEVLDIIRLPGGEAKDDEGVDLPKEEEEEEEGGRGIEKHVDVSFEVNVGVGVGKQDHHQEMEKRERRETTLRIAIKSCDSGGGGGVGTSVFESDGHYASDASKAVAPISPPLPSIPRRPSAHQKQKQKVNSWSSTPKRRGNSLGRDVITPSSANSRRHPHSQQNPYTRNHHHKNNHSPFQLQPAYTAGISCGLPVSRPQPFVTRSVVRPPLPPLPPLRGEGAMVVSRPGFGAVGTAATPLSAPPVSESVVDEWGRGDGV